MNYVKDYTVHDYCVNGKQTSTQQTRHNSLACCALCKSFLPLNPMVLSFGVTLRAGCLVLNQWRGKSVTIQQMQEEPLPNQAAHTLQPCHKSLRAPRATSCGKPTPPQTMQHNLRSQDANPLRFTPKAMAWM